MNLSRVALSLAFVLPLFAQTQSETLTVDYVEVPVNVVDRSGNPVRGLTKANFELYDDKARASVTSFDTIDFTSPESLRLAEGKPAAHRAFLVVFDLGYSSPHALERAQEAARTFVTKNVSRGDLVAVGTIDMLRGYKLVSNFTSDRGATLAAVANPAHFRAADPLQLSAQAGIGKAQADADYAAAVASGDPGAEALAQRADIANLEETDRREIALQQVHRQIDWLSQLAASLRNVRGRKQIVLLTEGFDPRLIEGHGARDVNQTNEQASMIMSGAWYMNGKALDMDRRYGSNSSISALQVLKQAFTGSDVILNAIDIQGVRQQSATSRGELDSSNGGLYLLANPTGGTVFTNSNDLSDNFARMLHQQELVYVLGFQTTVKSPGRLHDLKVKLVNVPAGMRIVHRQGYFEGGTQYTPLERTLNAADVITRDIAQDDVHLAAMAVPFPSKGENAQVAAVVEINGTDLLKGAKDDDIAAELFLYAFDESGAVRDRGYHRFALGVKSDGTKLRANGVKYIATFNLPPGKYAIKTLVRVAGDDRMGFVRTDLVVPKPGEMALLQPFLIDHPQSWVVVVGGRPDVQAPYPFHVNGEPFLPSVTGHVPTVAVRKVAVFISNARLEDVTWETTPQAVLLAEVKGADATKLVLQLDSSATARQFGVTVHKDKAVLTASTPLQVR
jgi:VWFA-related protein